MTSKIHRAKHLDFKYHKHEDRCVYLFGELDNHSTRVALSEPVEYYVYDYLGMSFIGIEKYLRLDTND